MVSRTILVYVMMIGRAAALFAFAPSSKSWCHTVPARVCSLSKWDKLVEPKVLCRTKYLRNSRRSYATTMQEQEGTAGSGREESLDRKILSIALPALGSLAIDPLLGLVDTLYLGQIPDARPLAALGVCTSVFNFAFFIFNFFATATTPLVSRAIAAGDKDSAIKTLGQAFTAALAIGLLSACAIEGFAPRILSAMSTSAEAMGDANGYLRVRALATPAVLLASVANGAFRGVQNTMTPLKILVAANVINFVFDPLLIFGVHIGDFDLLPPLGATGAAIATAVAEWGGCAALLISLNQQAPLAGAVKLMDSMPKWQEAEPLLRASGAVFVRSITLQTVLTSITICNALYNVCMHVYVYQYMRDE
jgi:putative MATE family efflux protein